MDLARARAWARSPHGQRALIAAVFLVLTVWYMAFAVQRYETSHFYGDEPEYYLNGVSIYADGDLDLRNQFLAPDPHAFPIPLTHKVPGGDAPVPATFMPTTGAVFIGPANAVAGVLGVLILFALMNLATLALLLVVLRRTFGPTVSLAAVALTGLIVPLAWHGASIWVEIPALLAITGALALLPWAGRRWWGATAIGVLLALLPWLHQKFAVLALGMAAAVLLHPARRRFWPLIAGLPIAGIVGTMVFSTALRGRWAFTTGSNTDDVSGAFDPRLGRYVTQPAAWMVDQTRGWIPLAPIWIVALIGLAVLLRAMGGRRQLAFYAVAFVPFFLVYMAGPFLSGDSPAGARVAHRVALGRDAAGGRALVTARRVCVGRGRGADNPVAARRRGGGLRVRHGHLLQQPRVPQAARCRRGVGTKSGAPVATSHGVRHLEFVARGAGGGGGGRCRSDPVRHITAMVFRARQAPVEPAADPAARSPVDALTPSPSAFYCIRALLRCSSWCYRPPHGSHLRDGSGARHHRPANGCAQAAPARRARGPGAGDRARRRRD